MYQSADVYQPVDMYQPADVYQPGDVYQPADMYQPVDMYQSADVYQPADMYQLHVGAAQQSFMKVGFGLSRYFLWDTLVFKWDGILGLTSMYVFF